MPGTIVFIHGLNLNPLCWGNWINYFQSKGYACHAPSYPFHEGSPADLRGSSHEGLRKLTFGKVVARLAAFIDTLDEKPLLIGHSMGGLAVQKLLELDKGVAGVSISSAPPRGIISFKWSFIRSNFPMINPLKGNSLFLPGLAWFRYAVCNTVSPQFAADVHDKFLVPESRNIPRSLLLREGHIDVGKIKQPLLFVSGEKDHITPASMNLKNFRAYRHLQKERDYRSFAGRCHAICWQDGWEEIAGYAEEWLRNAVAGATTPVKV
jgi:pimeloyl-ACP methyl ester carboxylesterase